MQLGAVATFRIESLLKNSSFNFIEKSFNSLEEGGLGSYSFLD
jgi:hypothetical protein